MPWFYYRGRTIRPIQIKKGVSVAVRPKSYVEIKEMTKETRALVGNKLQRKGRPHGMRSFVDEAPVENIEEEVPKSKLARFVAEKGITLSKEKPPVSKNGAEMVESEIAIDSKGDVKEDQVDKVEDVVTDEAPAVKKRGRRRKSESEDAV